MAERSAGAPMLAASPSTTLNTPSGTPARSASSASASAVSGVASAGLSTTVQPAAMAGATCSAPQQQRQSFTTCSPFHHWHALLRRSTNTDDWLLACRKCKA
eukprot:GHRQ01016365.1.p1 GENE.GHRQ01016365.1~~GHRQ01016365.1.p1  ORF type:complete len:102 (+),score=20.71 GHRQ01016365.1:34-339(+)